MNGKLKVLLAVTITCVGTCAFARHHHHNEGLALANGIVDLVCRVIAPAPVVVTPAPAPVVVTPPPPAPAPVVVTPAPAPVVVAPAPVYYRRPVPPPPPRRYHRPAPPPRNNRGHRR